MLLARGLVAGLLGEAYLIAPSLCKDMLICTFLTQTYAFNG